MYKKSNEYTFWTVFAFTFFFVSFIPNDLACRIRLKIISGLSIYQPCRVLNGLNIFFPLSHFYLNFFFICRQCVLLSINVFFLIIWCITVAKLTILIHSNMFQLFVAVLRCRYNSFLLMFAISVVFFPL